MPRITMELNGRPVEVDLSLAEFKELMGLPSSNGQHVGADPLPRRKRTRHIRKGTAAVTNSTGGGFQAFFDSITDRGRQFINILREHPNGIDGNTLARLLGFTNTMQIGGLIGGGSMSSLAQKHGVDLKDVYRRTTTFPNGVRTVTYYPQGLLWEAEENRKEVLPFEKTS